MKLLDIIFENGVKDNVNPDALYVEGKKIYPKLTLQYNAPKYEGIPRYFMNYPTNKGSYGLKTFKTILISKKIEVILKWLVDKGYAKDVNESVRTNSKYFVVNGVNVRLSDHPKVFDGLDVTVKWDSKGRDVIKEIVGAANMELSEDAEVFPDDSTGEDIEKSFKNQGHYKWFNIDPKHGIRQDDFERALVYTMNVLRTEYKYDLKRVVIKDKDNVVGFLIWSNNGSQMDDIGDGNDYPVLLSTAIAPEYRNRGLLKMMINKSGIQKPYLVHTSALSPVGLWERMGCEVAKNVGHGNVIKKCN